MDVIASYTTALRALLTERNCHCEGVDPAIQRFLLEGWITTEAISKPGFLINLPLRLLSRRKNTGSSQ
jgi:hypothetical protein